MQQSPGIRSIWTKVFGLTAILVTVMLVAAVVSFTMSYYKVNDVRQRVSNLAHLVVPLTQAAANIDAYSLQEEIQLERVLRKWTAAPNQRVLFQADIDRFLELEESVQQELRIAADVLAATLSDPQWLHPADAVEFGRTALLLENIDKEHAEFFDHARSVIENLDSSDPDATEQSILDLETEADHLDQELFTLLTGLEALNATQAEEIEAAESLILEIYLQNFVLTFIVFVIGIAASAVITTKLVTPVRDLKQKSEEITRGNLDIDVVPQTKDEIGQLASAFGLMASELRVKNRVKELFGKYVDPRIVESLLLDNSEHTSMQSHNQEMTIFFSDLKGFSAMTELLTPDGLVTLINRYFSMMAEPIIAERGVIDKYVGDCIMAFWGPPFTGDENQAVLACRAALAQFDQLKVFNAALPEILGLRQGLPDFQIRVGIGTGEVLTGNIGSDHTKSYTVMGDKVNIASRLENLNKQYGTSILIGELTRERIGDEFVVREIDQVVVAGKDESNRIFELVCFQGQADQQQIELVKSYEAGLQAYRNQEWDIAEQQFLRCLSLDQDDQPSAVMLDRVKEFRHSPPDSTWDGIWRFSAK